MINQNVGTKEYFETFYSSRTWNFYKRIISDMILLAEPGPILDVGAGLGFIVEGTSRWGLDCIGIEGSKEAIEIAQKRYPQIRLIQHLLSEPFPFPDQTFQTVIINQVIGHLEPEATQNAIREIYRVLSPGGCLFLNSPSKFENVPDTTLVKRYSSRELKETLIAQGFIKIQPKNGPLPLLGKSYLGKAIMYLIFKLFPWDRLSASVNYVVYKPVS